MKKNIIFVIPSMVGGGAERSLLTLLTLIDYDKYNVDLLLFNRGGLFYERIPKDVNIIDCPPVVTDFQKPRIDSLKSLIPKYPKAAFWRIVKIIYVSIVYNLKCYDPNKDWLFIKRIMPSLKKEYDYAIGYLQAFPIYMITDKIKAKKKIGYIHTDYIKANYDPDFDEYYFGKQDKIVTVSEASSSTLKQVFPQYSEKIEVIPNIVSERVLTKLSGENDNPFADYLGFKILTVGRLSKVKGYDLAIDALKILIDEGHKIRWYAIGAGSDEERIKRLIAKNNLQKYFILMGEKSNPYPYIKNTDLYVQTSRWEGWGIALQEALLLKKVVISTNFPCAHEQIQNGVDGIICEMTPESIADGIRRVITEPDLTIKIQESLINKQSKTAKSQMDYFYRILQ